MVITPLSKSGFSTAIAMNFVSSEWVLDIGLVLGFLTLSREGK